MSWTTLQGGTISRIEAKCTCTDECEVTVLEKGKMKDSEGGLGHLLEDRGVRWKVTGSNCNNFATIDWTPDEELLIDKHQAGGIEARKVKFGDVVQTAEER